MSNTAPDLSPADFLMMAGCLMRTGGIPQGPMPIAVCSFAARRMRAASQERIIQRFITVLLVAQGTDTSVERRISGGRRLESCH